MSVALYVAAPSGSRCPRETAWSIPLRAFATSTPSFGADDALGARTASAPARQTSLRVSRFTFMSQTNVPQKGSCLRLLTKPLLLRGALRA